MAFYDEIADDYDVMTGSGERSSKAEKFLSELVARFPIKSALDVACGTGLYAIGLAKMGVRATGTDVSTAMLDQARKHAQRAALSADWVCAPMQELAAKLSQRFDAVLCMGNSIPHLLTDADLNASIAGFTHMLSPGGIIVLQLLNYARIMSRRERIVGINRQADQEYVRFYDFLPGLLQFNILEINWGGREVEHRLHSTQLRPYVMEELRDALLRHGCQDVHAYSGLQFAPFDRDDSETVMLIGRA